MLVKRNLFLAGAALALALVSGAASAKTWDFSFAGDNGVSGSGELFTGASGSPFTVTGATGTISDTQGSLVGAPFTIDGLNGYAAADNLLYVPASQPSGYVDFGGISFSTTAGVDFNLGGGGTGSPSAVLNDSVNDPGGYPVPTFGSNNITLSITAVPEPASWAMVLLGIGGIGAGLRIARRKTDMALSAA
jgi:hypothetical protein